MPKYLVTYHGGPGMPSDPEVAQQMLQAFQAWASGAGSALVDGGAPLSRSKSVSSGGVEDGQSEAQIGGWSVLEASDLDAAAALVTSHPFVARGGTLQVSEAIDLGM